MKTQNLFAPKISWFTVKQMLPDKYIEVEILERKCEYVYSSLELVDEILLTCLQ